MTKKRVVVTISSFKFLVPGAFHYWATIHLVEGDKHFEEPFNSKAQARQFVREIVVEHFGDEEYDIRGPGGLDLPWMYVREGD